MRQTAFAWGGCPYPPRSFQQAWALAGTDVLIVIILIYGYLEYFCRDAFTLALTAGGEVGYGVATWAAVVMSCVDACAS